MIENKFYWKKLEQFCAPKQLEIIKLKGEGLSNRKAASKLGVTRTVVDRQVKAVKKKAAKMGYSPEHDMNNPTAQGFHVKGTSTLYGDDGSIKQQWVKTAKDAERFEEVQEALLQTLEDYKGKSPEVKPPKYAASDIMAVYPMGDPHIGMYSYAAETGDDFDLKIAEKNLTRATSQLVNSAPSCETALILNLGDFFHADNQENKTMRSGNALDVDTRWSKVLQVGFNIMLNCVSSALARHQKVIVKNIIGNHDDHSSIFLGLALKAFFQNNERVTVDISPCKFWYHSFGKALIGSTHGDGCKIADLGAVMATDKPQEWGQSIYRYWYTGHIHTKTVHELRGCTVESFRTLAGRDSWHHSKGYRAGRDMQAIILHKDYGEINRFTRSLPLIIDGLELNY